MSKVIGIAIFVLAMWFGMEVYNNGTAGAFGGVFVEMGWIEASADGVAPSTVKVNAGKALESAHAESDARRERLLAE